MGFDPLVVTLKYVLLLSSDTSSKFIILSITGYPKDVNEKNVNPLNEALTSFYSDLASIDNKTSDADCDATQSKSLSHHYVADSSSGNKRRYL